MTLAKLMQQRMNELNINKKQLSEAAGLPYMTVSNILQRGANKAGLQNVLAICRVLHIGASEIAVLSGPEDLENFRDSSQLSFGERLEFALRVRGVSKENLAERLKCDLHTIACFCNNTLIPEPHVYSLISWLLPVGIGWLMGVFNSPMDDEGTMYIYSESDSITLTSTEQEFISKFRALDDLSKDIVITIIDKELGRSGT